MGIDRGQKDHKDGDQSEGLNQHPKKSTLDITDAGAQFAIDKRIHDSPLHLPATQAPQAISTPGLVCAGTPFDISGAG